eukprot:4136075-Prymnesium_polylepis.1
MALQALSSALVNLLLLLLPDRIPSADTAARKRLQPHLRLLGLDDTSLAILSDEQAESLWEALQAQTQRKFEAALALLDDTHGAALPGRRLLSENSEGALRSHLLSAYSSRSAPVNPDGSPVQVRFGLNLYRVMNVDMSLGVLEVYVWVRMAWSDPRLAWDPRAWGVAGPISLIGAPATPTEDTEAW